MFLILRRGLFSVCKHHLDGLLKHKLLGPAPKELDSVGLGWTLKSCFSPMSPYAADCGSFNHGHKLFSTPFL